MIVFIGWWHETGLALSECAMRSSAVSALQPPNIATPCPYRVLSCTILVDFRMEDQDDMCNVLRVRWTIVPQTAPQPWIACSGCRGPRPFECSGKIRLNANGRMLDAWLIYKCQACQKTWNRPIFERQNVRDINPAVLDALQSNDAKWIREEAFNIEALRRKSQRIDESTAFDVKQTILRDNVDWTKLEIELEVPFPTRTRLDRLLASELAVSRARLQTLHSAGMLRVDLNRADVLRQRIKTGMKIAIDISTAEEREQLWRPIAARF
jgi:hypothetical protein